MPKLRKTMTEGTDKTAVIYEMIVFERPEDRYRWVAYAADQPQASGWVDSVEAAEAAVKEYWSAD